MLARPRSTFDSKPVSNSPERSGLRFAFPGLLATRLGTSEPVVELRLSIRTLPGLKRARPCVRPGCTPLTPYEVRRRISSSQLKRGKKLSSEIRYDRPAFGYTTRWKFEPNALFWSDRPASVRNRRSR